MLPHCKMNHLVFKAFLCFSDMLPIDARLCNSGWRLQGFVVLKGILLHRNQWLFGC